MRREECRHVIIKKSKSGGAEPLCVRGEINLSADNSCLELRGTVTAIAEARQSSIEVRQKINIHAAIRRNILIEPEITRLAAEIAFFQQFQRALMALKEVRARGQPCDCVYDQIYVVERWLRCGEKVGGKTAARPLEHGRELLERNRFARKFTCRTTPDDHIFDRIVRQSGSVQRMKGEASTEFLALLVGLSVLR